MDKMWQGLAESNCACLSTTYTCDMGGIIEAGQALLSQASRRLEVSALNMANITSPGYKARVPIQGGLVNFASLLSENNQWSIADNVSPGQAKATANPFDLAIMGEGFFVLRSPTGLVYSRNGEFRRDADGRLVNSAGLPLQGSEGDIVLKSDAPEILRDGTILENGAPVARIDILMVEHGGALQRRGDNFTSDAFMKRTDLAPVEQGMVESSNVSMAQEVTSLMQSQRSAETGQTLVRVYDDLMGRTLTAFGQSGS